MSSHFRFVVIWWPNGDFLPGDFIPYDDFLADFIHGKIPLGARVSKVSNVDHEFEVADIGTSVRLVARGGRQYTAKFNPANTSGVMLTRTK